MTEAERYERAETLAGSRTEGRPPRAHPRRRRAPLRRARLRARQRARRRRGRRSHPPAHLLPLGLQARAPRGCARAQPGAGARPGRRPDGPAGDHPVHHHELPDRGPALPADHGAQLPRGDAGHRLAGRLPGLEAAIRVLRAAGPADDPRWDEKVPRRRLLVTAMLCGWVLMGDEIMDAADVRPPRRERAPERLLSCDRRSPARGAGSTREARSVDTDGTGTRLALSVTRMEVPVSVAIIASHRRPARARRRLPDLRADAQEPDGRAAGHRRGRGEPRSGRSRSTIRGARSWPRRRRRSRRATPRGFENLLKDESTTSAASSRRRTTRADGGRRGRHRVAIVVAGDRRAPGPAAAHPVLPGAGPARRA